MTPVAVSRLVLALASAAAASCATTTAPVVATPTPPAPLTYEDKMTWILRLEEDRVLSLPAPPVPPPPAAVPAPSGRPAAVAAPALPPRPDLPALTKDDEARVRRRAALAIGRTRVRGGVAALLPLLATDPEPEVRQMAAFGLGLIGDASSAEALTAALMDAEPIVQGRAAEALGLVGHKPAAAAIGAMMAAHIKAGALTGIAADALEHPLSAPVEAVRLGMYALVRLGAFEPLAAALTDGAGRPVSRWWPVAYAFRRVGDPRAAPVLQTLLDGDGWITRAFAARGLGVLKEPRAVPALVALVSAQAEPAAVRIESIRSLADLGAAAAIEPLMQIVKMPAADPQLRLEALTALGQLRAAPALELFVDIVAEPWAPMRAAALTALSRTDPDVFITALSGLDPDPHWSVRAALAAALGASEPERARARLAVMLDDTDQRVIPAVLAALVQTAAPDAEAILTTRLDAEDVVVRAAAASGLLRLKAAAAVPALVRAYERAQKDPVYTARAAILAAVAGLDPAASARLLERALVDREWAVRVRAAELLTQITPAADLSAMRPAPTSVVPELNDLAPLIAPAVSPAAYVETDKGTIQIELAVLDAPRTVANFVLLARRNFLSGTPIHRVVPNFVVQDGDPRGDGEGGPGYTIRDEINQRPYLRGTVGMALDWEDTGGSQFFITLAPQPHLDGRYTVFGRVIAGMDVVDRLLQGDQIRSVRIWDGVSWVGR